MGWFGLLIREIPEITVFFASDSVPTQKTKKNKNPLKTTYSTHPKSPNLSAALLVGVCVFLSQRSPGEVCFLFFGQSVALSSKKRLHVLKQPQGGLVAVPFLELDQLGPGKTDRFFSQKNSNTKRWGVIFRHKKMLTDKLQQKEMGAWGEIFLGHRIEFFCF